MGKSRKKKKMKRSILEGTKQRPFPNKMRYKSLSRQKKQRAMKSEDKDFLEFQSYKSEIRKQKDIEIKQKKERMKSDLLEKYRKWI